MTIRTFAAVALLAVTVSCSDGASTTSSNTEAGETQSGAAHTEFDASSFPARPEPMALSGLDTIARAQELVAATRR